MMDVSEFEDLLGRHGSDLSNWPKDRQAAAEELLKTSEQARAALAELRQLRSALQSTPVRAPAGLVDRIMREVGGAEGDRSDRNTTDLDDAPSTLPKD